MLVREFDSKEWRIKLDLHVNIILTLKAHRANAIVYSVNCNNNTNKDDKAQKVCIFCAHNSTNNKNDITCISKSNSTENLLIHCKFSNFEENSLITSLVRTVIHR